MTQRRVIDFLFYYNPEQMIEYFKKTITPENIG